VGPPFERAASYSRRHRSSSWCVEAVASGRAAKQWPRSIRPLLKGLHQDKADAQMTVSPLPSPGTRGVCLNSGRCSNRARTRSWSTVKAAGVTGPTCASRSGRYRAAGASDIDGPRDSRAKWRVGRQCQAHKTRNRVDVAVAGAGYRAGPHPPGRQAMSVADGMSITESRCDARETLDDGLAQTGSSAGGMRTARRLASRRLPPASAPCDTSSRRSSTRTGFSPFGSQDKIDAAQTRGRRAIKQDPKILVAV